MYYIHNFPIPSTFTYMPYRSLTPQIKIQSPLQTSRITNPKITQKHPTLSHFTPPYPHRRRHPHPPTPQDARPETFSWPPPHYNAVSSTSETWHPSPSSLPHPRYHSHGTEPDCAGRRLSYSPRLGVSIRYRPIEWRGWGQFAPGSHRGTGDVDPRRWILRRICRRSGCRGCLVRRSSFSSLSVYRALRLRFHPILNSFCHYERRTSPVSTPGNDVSILG
mmetsp:Transcript_4803/g.9858  ORF Transcript_4803/g.9858 Transcript_4803/m.9858 type:complete len:220 (-) Transcript_4803:220-879(-)